MKPKCASALIYRSHLKWEVWRRAVRQIVIDPGCSAAALCGRLGLGSYRTGWRMSLLIRTAMSTVRWPELRGRVELCDHSDILGASSCSIWVAVEARNSAGLVAAWCNLATLSANHDHARKIIHADADLVVPRSVHFRALGASHRLLSCEKSEPVKPRQFLEAVQVMLRRRRHQAVTPGSLHAYLGEAVFRHNVRELGWSSSAAQRAVLHALREPSG